MVVTYTGVPRLEGRSVLQGGEQMVSPHCGPTRTSPTTPPGSRPHWVDGHQQPTIGSGLPCMGGGPPKDPAPNSTEQISEGWRGWWRSSGDTLKETASFPAQPQAAEGSQPGGWGLGEALLQQEPIRVHGQRVEPLTVTWQGLLPDSPLAFSACSSASFSFSLSRRALGRGFSSSFSWTSEREPGRPLALTAYLWPQAASLRAASCGRNRDPLLLQVLHRRGLLPLLSVCLTSLWSVNFIFL